MADPNCPLVQYSPSSLHCILGLVSTFKHYVMLPFNTYAWTFMCDDFSVHNDWCKFFIGFVFSITMPLHPMFSFNILVLCYAILKTFIHGHFCVTFLHKLKCPKIYQNRLMVNHLRDSYESPIKIWHVIRILTKT